MADDTIILWEGVPIKDLSREKLYEMIRHLMLELCSSVLTHTAPSLFTPSFAAPYIADERHCPLLRFLALIR